MLRQEISQLRQLKAEFNDVRNDFAKMSADKEEFPLLPGHAAEAGDQDIVADEAGSAGPTRVAGSQLFTDHARQLKDVGIKQLAGNKRSSGISIRKPVRKPLIGASTSNKRLTNTNTK